ncbi:MAG TPA: hypothetical protein VGQ58_11495 [Candidatus Limnocylindrales bacterium]|nr:hypothetical protein [Candidatus Limnocylindrales bacterium]
MQRRNAIAAAALITALALVALPAIGWWRPAIDLPLDAAAFLDSLRAATGGPFEATAELDPDRRSDGFVEGDAPFVEPVADRSAPIRPAVEPPAVAPRAVDRPPRMTLSGYASYYDRGSTAMRLPRGTLVVICGKGGCIERTVTDYGPNETVHPERVADLYRPDFFAICGCPSWSGTTWVTVKVY